MVCMFILKASLKRSQRELSNADLRVQMREM